MNLSKLDKRITIQKPVKTSDRAGGFTETWTDLAGMPVWAAIWPVSAKQMMADERLMSEISHRIRIRYRRGIKSSYRVKYKNRYFSIIGEPINPQEDGEWLDMMCKEVA